MISQFVRTSDGYWNIATITRVRKINPAIEREWVDGVFAVVTIAGHDPVGIFEKEYIELVEQIELSISDCETLLPIF